MYKAHIRKDGTVQLLADHLRNVSNLSSAFSEKIGMKSFGYISGLLHDYGKYNDLFQRYLESGTGNLKNGDERYVDYIRLKGKIDHSTAGAQYVENFNLDTTIIKQTLQMVIASHHGGLLDFINTEGAMPFQKRMAKELNPIDDLKHQIDLEYLEEIDVFKKNNNLEREFSAHFEKLKNLGDREIVLFLWGMTVRFLFSSLIDGDRTDTADFESPERLEVKKKNLANWSQLEEIFNRNIKGFQRRNEIDDFRNLVSDACFEKGQLDPGIYQLTVPTGGGKTLASFRFALEHVKKHQMDRIFYIIPYTSIIDQNAQTLRDIFKEEGLEDVILEHHSNLTPEEDTEINQIASENWDAPIVYTTMVQFLETLFSGGTRSVRRLHQLANAVIIFDEIQTLGIKNIYMFNLAMRYLTKVCHSTIVLCTATQPVLDSPNLGKYRIGINERGNITENIKGLEKAFKRVTVHNYTQKPIWRMEDTVELIKEQIEKEKSVLTIANTKKSALLIANSLQEKGYEVYHLSTSMCPAHRIFVLEDVRKKLINAKEPHGKPLICVSTQLIEAGVDVDFDVVIRHLAGLDNIVQAAGRCNRNGLLETGDLYIVDPIEETLGKLEDIKKEKEITKRVMSEYEEDKIGTETEEDLLSAKYMERYFQLYFYQRKDKMDYPVFIKESGTQENILNLLSKNSNAVKAAKRGGNKNILPYGFKTSGKYYHAIESVTRGVIVPYEQGEEIINQLCAANNPFDVMLLLKKAQKYSVNLFPYQLDQLFKEGHIFETQTGSGILYLSNDYYGEYGVGLKSGVGGMATIL